MSRRVGRVLVAAAVALLAACGGGGTAEDGEPYGVPDVVAALEDAGRGADVVSEGDGSGGALGTAELDSDGIVFTVDVFEDEAAATAAGGRRYGNLIIGGLDDGLQEDSAVISAIADALLAE